MNGHEFIERFNNLSKDGKNEVLALIFGMLIAMDRVDLLEEFLKETENKK